MLSTLISLPCVSTEQYPRKLNVLNHHCLDDRMFISDWYYFSHVVCRLYEPAGLEQCAGASSASIVLTVLAIRLTEMKRIAMNFSFLDELILENGYNISRTVSSTISEMDWLTAQGLQIRSMCVSCAFHTAPLCKRVLPFALLAEH